MEARRIEESVSIFIGKLRDEMAEIGSVMDELRDLSKQPDFSAVMTVAEEKFLSLIALTVMLNSGNLDEMLRKIGSQPILRMYEPLIFINFPMIVQKVINNAKTNGQDSKKSSLLHLYAFTANVGEYDNLSQRVGFDINSAEYINFLLEEDASPLLPIAPLYIAAYSGNLNLLRYLCDKLDIYQLAKLDKNNGLSLMHFAAMGGDVEVVDFLHKELHSSLDQLSRDGISVFAYSALSNNPSVISKLLELGYKPTEKDKSDYQMLYATNEVIQMRNHSMMGYPKIHDMSYAMRELTGDPQLAEAKEARQSIAREASNAINILDDMLSEARALVRMRSVEELRGMRDIARDIFKEFDRQVFPYLAEHHSDSVVRRAIQDALHKIEAKVNQFEELIKDVSSQFKAQRNSSPVLFSASPSSSISRPISSSVSSSSIYASRMPSPIARSIPAEDKWLQLVDKNVALTRFELEDEKSEENEKPSFKPF